jgi:hypothetical protein
MNEDIIKWAREAGWSGIYTQWISGTEHKTLPIPVTMEELSRFAALVRADEREACAKLCDDQHDKARTSTGAARANACAAAIRERKT